MASYVGYEDWVAAHDPDVVGTEIDLIVKMIGTFDWRPHFSVFVLPGDGSSAGDVLRASLERQIYTEWSVEAVAVGLTPDDFAALIARSAADFFIVLDPDIQLARHALFEFALALQTDRNYAIVFGDEDEIASNTRTNPTFKTDFDRVFAVGKDTIGCPAAFNRSISASLVGRTSGSPLVSNWTYEMTLLLMQGVAEDRLHHIPAILAHRHHPARWDAVDARAFLTAHHGTKGHVAVCTQDDRFSRLVRDLPPILPLVSIIIPTRDQPQFIRTVLAGVLTQTTYAPLEIIVIDNGTSDPLAVDILAEAKRDARVTVIRDDGPFNYSRLNNECALLARGEFLLLLNNDIEVLHPDWLDRLVAHFDLPGVGVVGAKLMYPDTRIQHAGVVFGPDDAIIQQYRLEPSDGSSTFDGVVLSRTVSSVTAACMLMPTSLFRDVGGFDEELAVGFNDIDLCRKAAEAGYRIVYAADAELVHHESVSRGQNVGATWRARERNEKHIFWRKHKDLYRTPDPFHNPNIVCGFFATTMSWPPRRTRPWRDGPQRSDICLY